MINLIIGNQIKVQPQVFPKLTKWKMSHQYLEFMIHSVPLHLLQLQAMSQVSKYIYQKEKSVCLLSTICVFTNNELRMQYEQTILYAICAKRGGKTKEWR